MNLHWLNRRSGRQDWEWYQTTGNRYWYTRSIKRAFLIAAFGELVVCLVATFVPLTPIAFYVVPPYLGPALGLLATGGQDWLRRRQPREREWLVAVAAYRAAVRRLEPERLYTGADPANWYIRVVGRNVAEEMLVRADATEAIEALRAAQDGAYAGVAGCYAIQPRMTAVLSYPAPMSTHTTRKPCGTKMVSLVFDFSQANTPVRWVDVAPTVVTPTEDLRRVCADLAGSAPASGPW